MVSYYVERECNLENSKLLRKLENYPTLRALLGEKWFLKKFSERESSPHLLIELLLEEKLEVEHVTNLLDGLQDSLRAGKIKEFLSIDRDLARLLYFSEFVKNLESHLNKLNPIKGFTGIGKKLRELDTPDKFVQTVNEIEIASSLLGHFKKMELETEPNHFETSIIAKNKDRIIRLSFVTPETVEEFSKKIDNIGENLVIIPIMHMQHLRKLKLKDLHSIKKLTGFVTYDRIVYYGRPILMGLYIENPKAKNELTKKEIKSLCSSLHLLRFPTAKLDQIFSKKSVQKKLKKGGFHTTQSFIKELFAKHLADWTKTSENINLILLLMFSLLRSKSDKYEYHCFELSSILHLSALNINAQNWWRELTRLKESFRFLQEGIAQIQNLGTILSSKRKASEEIKITLLLPYYTSTVEGIFKIMLRVIVTAINIVTGKSSKSLSKVGIPKLVNRINSFNKGELKILTKGYSSTLRNAISHGNYEVDLHGKKIHAIDRKKNEVFTFSQIKKMRKRLEEASFMVTLSLITILIRVGLEQERARKSGLDH